MKYAFMDYLMGRYYLTAGEMEKLKYLLFNSYQYLYIYKAQAKAICKVTISHLTPSGESRTSKMGDANPKGGGANLLFGPIFPENWMKLKSVGVRRLPGAPANDVRHE